MVKLYGRVKVNVTTIGTGDITFGSPTSNAFMTPLEAGVLDGDTVSEVLMEGDEFEEGTGVVRDTSVVMSRTLCRSKIAGVVGTDKMILAGNAVLALPVASPEILTPYGNLAGIPDK